MSSPAAASQGVVRHPEWVIHCDGTALPNPGRMGLGAVLVAPGGATTSLSRQAPGTGCNNEAELRALLLALDEACRQGALCLVISSDSSVLVDQMRPHSPNAPAPRPIARLAPMFEEARRALQRFDTVRWQWIPRHRNGQADALARAAVGLAPKPHSRPRSATRSLSDLERRKRKSAPARTVFAEFAAP
ncbi:reverse transcriptase-like protein [Acidovorax sp.]|uniref:reverse transcriptase-like protein n=1 Tax=Acidovorax sp. TaxID=1872122 RepID=UPI00391F2832